MRICIIGDRTGNIDEGMKCVAYHLTQELSQNHPVLSLNPKGIFAKSLWKNIKRFKPQIIHYIPGPSIVSFIFMKAIKTRYNSAKTVMSAMKPELLFPKKLIPLLKPDLILTQSHDTERMFTSLGCKTKFLPSGVDVKKFIPVPEDIKEKLRDKYGVDRKKFVILHVGHIKKERNIRIFKTLQKENNQVIIVGSTTTGVKHNVAKDLKEKGCIVWSNYFKNIEEIYALSDCYVFPTVSRVDSIGMPLSVMEAMACNLPVITTKFEALPRIFEEGDGLIFVEKIEDFNREIQRVKNDELKIRTREKVMPYSWENVAEKLSKIYGNIISTEVHNEKRK